MYGLNIRIMGIVPRDILSGKRIRKEREEAEDREKEGCKGRRIRKRKKGGKKRKRRG